MTFPSESRIVRRCDLWNHHQTTPLSCGMAKSSHLAVGLSFFVFRGFDLCDDQSVLVYKEVITVETVLQGFRTLEG